MYNVKCVQGFLKDASLHEGEQGKLFVETLTCLDDRLSYCKTKILLRSKFSPAQTLHRRNTQKLVKPLRLPPVFQVQGSDLLFCINLLYLIAVTHLNKLEQPLSNSKTEYQERNNKHGGARTSDLY